MSFYPSLMKKTLLSLSIASICSLPSTLLAEQSTEQVTSKKVYQAPTRGFFLEHGTVAEAGQASVDLHTGDISSGGGIRLGLPNAELLLNTGMNRYDENSALLKWSLPRQNSDGTEQTPFLWSLLAGVGYNDIDNGAFDETETNLTLGISATLKADAGMFTVSPKLIYAKVKDQNSNINDNDTFFELDLGAYVGLIETEAGLFSVGAEAQITTQDDTDNTIALGGRWLYNERINLDIVPFVFSNSDVVGIPGLVRLNVAF
jgi:hypothetical protein